MSYQQWIDLAGKPYRDAAAGDPRDDEIARLQAQQRRPTSRRHLTVFVQQFVVFNPEDGRVNFEREAFRHGNRSGHFSTSKFRIPDHAARYAASAKQADVVVDFVPQRVLGATDTIKP